MTPYHTNNKQPEGFTLIEILTTAVLSAMLLALFMALTVKFIAVFDQLRGGESRIEILANNALDQIEDDLSSVFINSNDTAKEWLAYWDHPAFAQNDLGTLKYNGQASNIAKDLQPHKSGILLFFSMLPNRTSGIQMGDTSPIAYRLGYLDPILGKDQSSFYSTFNLYRIKNNPSITVDYGNSGLASFWTGLGDSNKSLGERTYGLNDLEPDFIVARNVVDFRISFICSCVIPQDNNQERFFTLPPRDDSITPSTSLFRIGGDNATNETSKYNLPSIIPKDVRVYPSAAEVSITLLDDNGLKILWAVRDGNLPAEKAKNLDQLVEEHGQTFSRIIRIQRQI